ncbi:MAG: LicD family protein [Clostridia bacterium]|nr:LicD family protein [Clostridia bacterium]
MKKSNILEKVRVKYIQPRVRKMMGYGSIEEEISTIHYFLNSYFDITSFPPATGVLRKAQLVDAELLRIFDSICEKHGLTYWLDYGTLLGAYRHKGFIPWDDDLDVAMPRADYDRAFDILYNDLKNTIIEIHNGNERRIALSIWKAGAIMDIFPIDNVPSDAVSSHDALRLKAKQYRRYYKKKCNKKSISPILLSQKKEQVIGKYTTVNPIWYHNPEFAADGTVFDNDVIFPLTRLSFEGYSLSVPHDCHMYLTECYGDYMSFPHNGILHHKGGTDSSITNNSFKYNVDMDDLLSMLRTIEQR